MEWKENTCPLPKILRGKKTLSLQLWHYFSPLLLCDGSPGLASFSGNFHRVLCYWPFLRSHSILCLGVTKPVRRLSRAESPVLLIISCLANAGKHGLASQLLFSTDVWYGFPFCMGSGACWALPWTNSAQYNNIKCLGVLWRMGGKAWLLFHWFSRFHRLSGLPSWVPEHGKQKHVAESRVSKRSGEEGMARSY